MVGVGKAKRLHEAEEGVGTAVLITSGDSNNNDDRDNSNLLHTYYMPGSVVDRDDLVPSQ